MLRTRSRWATGTLEHAVTRGATVGIAAALPTVALLMIAGGTYRGIGFATPMYSVISVLDPTPMFAALEAVGRGAAAPFQHQAFVAGLATCLMLGAVSGVVFTVGVTRHQVRNWRALAIIGPMHGILMMALFYLGVLFVLSKFLNADLVAFSLSGLVGWPTLIAAHVLYGVVLAVWAARRGPDTAPPVPKWQQR
ncbi:hypothetical protein [Lentzea sp. NPDC051838]|uniref:hypothetical protein n=1 Tax=Lentzea sp. NPDC051838 TaxID=3154849 RepID=UPI0034227B7C